MKKLIMMVMVTLAFSLSAALSNNIWQAPDKSGDWTEPSNWSLKHVPTADENAYFPNLEQDFTVTVSSDVQVGAIEFEAKTGSRKTTTFSGDGTITIMSTSQSCAFRDRRDVYLDGVSMVWNGACDILIYARLTIGTGAKFVHKRFVNLWSTYAGITLEGGEFSCTEAVKYYGTTLNESSLIVNSGTFYSKQLYQNTTDKPDNPFAVIINGGSAQFRDFQLQRDNCALQVNGGEMLVDLVFEIDANVDFAVSGGTLTIPNVTQVSADCRKSFTGGTIVINSDVSDLGMMQTEGTVVDLKGNRLVVSSDARLEGTMLKLGAFRYGSGAAAKLTAQYDEIVFSGTREPFTIGDRRDFYLEGPTVVKAAADMPDTCGSTWWLHFTGDLTIDTRDPDDGVSPRHVSLLNLHPIYGSCVLRVFGGGSFSTIQSAFGDTFRSVTVEANTTLKLLNISHTSSDRNPMSAEVFRMAAGSTLELTAGYNHVAAGSFDVDPTAAIKVTIPDAANHGAFAVLQSLGNATPDSALLSQITLAGNSSGWSLKAENGQITVYKAGEVSGDYATEWVGGGADDKVGNVDNFYSSLPSSSVPIYFGANTTRTTATWGGRIADGYTLAGLHWLDSAIETFTYNGGGETMTKTPTMVSYSGVPQKHTGGIRTGGVQMQTYRDGYLLFEGSNQSWGGQYYSDNRCTWYIAGDCRVSKPKFVLDKLALQGVLAGSKFSRLTILNGATFTITNLISSQAGGTAFRVERGGTLTIDKGNGSPFYQWESRAAKTTVDGTMNIEAPVRGGADLPFGGSGTLLISSVAPGAQSSRIWLEDALQTNLENDWPSGKDGSDVALGLGVVGGSPVLKVSDGWTYGVPTGTSTASGDARAILIWDGASLSVDADGGCATIREAVVGKGRLSATNGVLKLSADFESDIVLAACADATLDIGADVRAAGLEAQNGSLVKIAEGKCLALSGSVDLDGVAISPELPARGWRTVLTAASIDGLPIVPGDMSCRVSACESGEALECKMNVGVLLIVR